MPDRQPSVRAPPSVSSKATVEVSGGLIAQFLTMLGKMVAPAIVAVLVLVLATDAFAMGGSRRRRGGAADNGNGAGPRTLSDAEVAQLQAEMDRSGSSEIGPNGAYSGEGGTAWAPEPGSMLLLASGAAGLAAWRWRRRRSAR